MTAVPRRGSIPARLLLAIGLAGALALGLLAGLSPAPAQAGCPICDSYTLDIPDPTGNGGGSFEAGSDPDPAPEATTPVPATTTPVPATTVPATTAAVTSDDSNDDQKPKHEAAPSQPFVPVRVDGPPVKATVLTSVPLDYEGEDSAPGAALAGLGSPGTIALLAALIAAGAAVAVGRRRAPAT